MATIKLQNGNVITKNGKVACTCCVQPIGCCMYPAQGLVNGTYSANDLPDKIEVWNNSEGVLAFTLEKTGAEYIYVGPGISFLEKLAIVNGSEQYPYPFWAAYLYVDEGVPIFAGTCLINAAITDDFIVQDQFANSYTVTGPPGGPVTVTRQSLCVWTGSDTCGNGVTLEFISDNDNNENFWLIGWFNYLGPCITFDSSSGTKRAYAQGGDGIDTPVGNYYENVGQPPIGSVL